MKIKDMLQSVKTGNGKMIYTQFLIALLKDPDVYLADSTPLRVEQIKDPTSRLIYEGFRHCMSQGVPPTPQAISGFIDSETAVAPLMSILTYGGKKITDSEKVYTDQKIIIEKVSLLIDFERRGIQSQTLPDSLIESGSKEAIIEHIMAPLDDIRMEYTTQSETVITNCDEDIDSLEQKFKAENALGLYTNGSLYNHFTQGAKKGNLEYRSAASGTGKTRTAVADASKLAFDYRYNSEVGDYVYMGRRERVTFITTELTIPQIQVMFIAYLAGINAKRIEANDLTGAEQDRVNRAKRVIKDASETFLIVYMPEPTISGIKGLVNKLCNKEKMEYIFFDYLHETPSLISEHPNVPIWTALENFSGTLKALALRHQCYIQSSTQLNSEGNLVNGEVKGFNCIKGSKAIVNKADVLTIIHKVDSKTKKTFSTYCQQAGLPEPTHIIDLPKTRFTEGNNYRIFAYYDLGTLEMRDLFATDMDNNIVPIETRVLGENEQGLVVVSAMTGQIDKKKEETPKYGY